MPAFEDKPQAAYETPAKKRSGIRRYVFIGIGILALLGMGSCVWMFVGMFQQMGDRQTATKAFVERLFVDGLPGSGDELYHRDAEITQSALDEVNGMLRDYGTPSSIGEPSCNINVSANTNSSENGTFANCVTEVEYVTTSGRLTVKWKMQDEEWKLIYFYTNYDKALEPTPEEPAPNVHGGD